MINGELAIRQVDIAALHKTRLPDSGSLGEVNYTFSWQGKERYRSREFVIKNSLLNLLSVYTPTQSTTAYTKDELYDELNSLIAKIHKDENLIYDW